MKVWIGIDLGSTTTKAVVLDEHERILGRGITNSRSDYEVACEVARSEALTAVRFELCRRALEGLELDPRRREALLDALERHFRLARHRLQLDRLREVCERTVPQVEALYGGLELAAAVGDVLDEMAASAAAHFEAGATRKSDFFRDLAASDYARVARRLAHPERRPFEALLAVFDKAILEVENEVHELAGRRGAEAAIEGALAQAAPGDEAARRAAAEALGRAFETPIEEVDRVGTGYGRATLPFEKRQIRSEILCHGLGAHFLFPGTRTVLDIGGQDTKAIQVDENGIVTSFQMNDRCAAGCGRYLGYIADEMNLGLHELGPLAKRSRAPVRINSTCTVFAGAEIRDRLTLGQRREDILAGLHRAVMLRAMSLLARSGGVHEEFTFTGGVAKNETAVDVLRELVRENYGERTMNVSPDSIYTGALGAALFARRGGAVRAAEAAA